MSLQTIHFRRNIELKARCPDIANARAAAQSAGATPSGLLHQVDTYFNARNGRLKLRQIAGQPAQLIAYSREDRAEARGSDYTIVQIENEAALRTALASTLGIQTQVVKQRELWLWQNVRIHLDIVEDLGSFIEFEAVLEGDDTDEQGHQKIAHLCQALNVRAEDRLAVSYLDMAADVRL